MGEITGMEVAAFVGIIVCVALAYGLLRGSQ